MPYIAPQFFFKNCIFCVTKKQFDAQVQTQVCDYHYSQALKHTHKILEVSPEAIRFPFLC